MSEMRLVMCTGHTVLREYFEANRDWARGVAVTPYRRSLGIGHRTQWPPYLGRRYKTHRPPLSSSKHRP